MLTNDIGVHNARYVTILGELWTNSRDFSEDSFYACEIIDNGNKFNGFIHGTTLMLGIVNGLIVCSNAVYNSEGESLIYFTKVPVGILSTEDDIIEPGEAVGVDNVYNVSPNRVLEFFFQQNPANLVKEQNTTQNTNNTTKFNNMEGVNF